MTLGDREWHRPTASLFRCDFFVLLYSIWQDLNWHSVWCSPLQ